MAKKDKVSLDQVVNESHLVIYCDGSASPNPGSIGSASHGYVYKDVSKNKYILYDNLITKDGYCPIEDNIECVEPLYFIEKNYSFDFIGSNNYAEIFALKQILGWMVKNELYFKSVLIYSDSSYVVNTVNEWMANWKNNNWIKNDGREVSEKDLWIEIDNYLILLKDKSDITVNWIKGHNGNLGNMLADFSANVARYNSTRGIYTQYEKIIDAKDYFNSKTDIHPLLCFKNILLPPKNTKEYYLYNSKLPDHLIGKHSNETSYSIVYLKESDEVIEEVKTFYYDRKYNNSVSLLKLKTLKEKKYLDRIKNCAFNSLLNKDKTNSLMTIDGTVIVQEINPPGLLLRALDYYEHLNHIIDDIHNNKDKLKLLDITSYFYDIETKLVNKKEVTKYTLNKEIHTGFKNMDLNIDYENTKIKLPTILGYDMPGRNDLKKLESQNPKIILVIMPVTPESFDYCIYIETNDTYSIWSNASTARIFIKR